MIQIQTEAIDLHTNYCQEQHDDVCDCIWENINTERISIVFRRGILKTREKNKANMLAESFNYIFFVLRKVISNYDKPFRTFHETITPIGWFYIRHFLIWKLTYFMNKNILKTIHTYIEKSQNNDRIVIQYPPWDLWIDTVLKLCIMPYRVQNSQHMRAPSNKTGSNTYISRLSYNKNGEFHITLLADKTGKEDLLPVSIGVGKSISYILKWFFFFRHMTNNNINDKLVLQLHSRASQELTSYIHNHFGVHKNLAKTIFIRQHHFRMMIVNAVGFITNFDRHRLNMMGLITRDDVKTLEKCYTFWSRLGTLYTLENRVKKLSTIEIEQNKLVKHPILTNFLTTFYGIDVVGNNNNELYHNNNANNINSTYCTNICTQCGKLHVELKKHATYRNKYFSNCSTNGHTSISFRQHNPVVVQTRYNSYFFTQGSSNSSNSSSSNSNSSSRGSSGGGSNGGFGVGNESSLELILTMTIFDAMRGMGLLIACVLTSYIGNGWFTHIDMVLSLCTCIFIFVTVWPIFENGGTLLLQRSPKNVNIQSSIHKCIKTLAAERGVLEIRDQHFWQQTDDLLVGSLSVLVDGTIEEEKMTIRVQQLFEPMNLFLLTVQVMKEKTIN